MTTPAREDDDPVQFFRRELLWWWRRGGRAFPWRETRDPYHVLIAELMLRRTRADQVVPVYSEFLRRYPTVSTLAGAEPDDVAALLYPLGLTWRVSAFRGAAKAIMENHGGVIPRERDALIALPGVGDYVADAIRAFAFNIPTAVVDTNTVRVAGRYLGFSVEGEARRRREVIHQIRLLVGQDNTRELNLAVLDLGALVCRAANPLCESCPVRHQCVQARPRLGVHSEGA